MTLIRCNLQLLIFLLKNELLVALGKIHIGGLFNQFNKSDFPDAAGSQMLASFMMAIREV